MLTAYRRPAYHHLRGRRRVYSVPGSSSSSRSNNHAAGNTSTRTTIKNATSSITTTSTRFAPAGPAISTNTHQTTLQHQQHQQQQQQQQQQRQHHLQPRISGASSARVIHASPAIGHSPAACGGGGSPSRPRSAKRSASERDNSFAASFAHSRTATAATVAGGVGGISGSVQLGERLLLAGNGGGWESFAVNVGCVMSTSQYRSRYYNSGGGGGGGGGYSYCPRRWFWTAAAVTAVTAAATMSNASATPCKADASTSFSSTATAVTAAAAATTVATTGAAGEGGVHWERGVVRSAWGERESNSGRSSGGGVRVVGLREQRVEEGGDGGGGGGGGSGSPGSTIKMSAGKESCLGQGLGDGGGGGRNDDDDGNINSTAADLRSCSSSSLVSSSLASSSSSCLGSDSTYSDSNSRSSNSGGAGGGGGETAMGATGVAGASSSSSRFALRPLGASSSPSYLTAANLGPVSYYSSSVEGVGRGGGASGRGLRALSVTSGDSATADGRGAGGVVGSGAGGAGGVDGPEGKAVPVAGRVLFTSAQAAKGHRSYMEDEFFLSPDGSFAAVYDGHGGALVSKYLRQNLYKQVLENLPSGVDVYDLPTMQQALQVAFKTVDDYVVAQTPYQHQGSTAVAVVVHCDRDGKGSIISCNVGDSRAVLSRRGEALDLTEDHKPNAPRELERIKSHNGKVHWFGFLDPEGGPMEGTGVYRINGNLAVARAIGDIDERPFVSGECEMRTIDMNPETDQFVILATDGLWDVMTSEEAVQYVHTVMGGAMGALREGDLGHGRGPDGAAASGSDRPVHMTLSDWTQRFADDRGMIRAAMMLRKKKMARYLTEEAIRRGSMDNTTVVVVWLQ